MIPSMLKKMTNWNDMKFERSRIVCNAKKRRYSRPGETFCCCGRMLQGITDEVKKQAEQRISRYIMWVSGIHDLVLKILTGSDAMDNLKNAQKLKWTENYSAHQHNCGAIVDSYLNDEQYQNGMQEQGYTQTKMKQFDRRVVERKNYEKGLTTETNTWSCNPTKEEAATPCGPKNICVQWKKENFTKSRCRTVVIVWPSWSSWTWSLSTRSFWWDYSSSSHQWRQSPWSTSPHPAAHILSDTAFPTENNHTAILCCETNQ